MGKTLLVWLVIASLCFQNVLSDIGGRTTCSTVTRSPTADATVSANCAKLTITEAATACTASIGRPTLTPANILTTGAGNNGPVCPVTLPSPLVDSITFTIPTPTTDYLLDIELVSTSDPLAKDNYLQVTNANPAVVQQRTLPPVDVSQVYSAVLINKNSKAASLPQYFQVNLKSCQVSILGPSSITICTNDATAGNPVVKLDGTATFTASDGSTVNIVSVLAPGQVSPAYLTVGGTTAANTATISPLVPAIPSGTFTQIYTINTPAVAPFTASKQITVTFDPSGTCLTTTVNTATKMDC